MSLLSLCPSFLSLLHEHSFMCLNEVNWTVVVFHDQRGNGTKHVIYRPISFSCHSVCNYQGCRHTDRIEPDWRRQCSRRPSVSLSLVWPNCILFCHCNLDIINRRWIMSRIVIVIIIYHRHEPRDIIGLLGSYRKRSMFPVRYGQTYSVELSFK
jgi:hypothetical protein